MCLIFSPTSIDKWENHLLKYRTRTRKSDVQGRAPTENTRTIQSFIVACSTETNKNWARPNCTFQASKTARRDRASAREHHPVRGHAEMCRARRDPYMGRGPISRITFFPVAHVLSLFGFSGFVSSLIFLQVLGFIGFSFGFCFFVLFLFLKIMNILYFDLFKFMEHFIHLNIFQI
jgi:hypothetical protein